MMRNIIIGDLKVILETNACSVSLSLQEKLMGHLGVVLYEYLGEEYPEVLGSILGALKAIVNVIGKSPHNINNHCFLIGFRMNTQM